MKNFLAMLILSMTLNSSAFAAGPSFEAWIGTWKGSCKLTPAYQGVEQLDTSLVIAKTAVPEKFQWQSIYEASGPLPKEVRDYEMLTIDTAKGHYVLDEKNGLLLDSYLTDKVLHSPFTVNGNLVLATYILLNNKEMMIDMASFHGTPTRKTCLTGNPNLCTESFGLKVSQHCRLRLE